MASYFAEILLMGDQKHILVAADTRLTDRSERCRNALSHRVARRAELQVRTLENVFIFRTNDIALISNVITSFSVRT